MWRNKQLMNKVLINKHFNKPNGVQKPPTQNRSYYKLKELKWNEKQQAKPSDYQVAMI